MEEERLLSLFLKYRFHTLSATEFAELRSWIDASSDNRERFCHLVQMRNYGIVCDAFSRFDTNKAWNHLCRKKYTNKWRIRLGWGTVAAAILLGIVWLWNGMQTSKTNSMKLDELFPEHGSIQALVLSRNIEKTLNLAYDSLQITSPTELREWNLHFSTRSENRIEVPRGGEYTFFLPDGTNVWLNAGSTLSFNLPFDSMRIVRLTGEAYFQVVHHAKPFIVEAKEYKICVKGTRFNVRAYESEPLQVSLLQGCVEVKSNKKLWPLYPGEQWLAQSANAVPKVIKADVEKTITWTEGVFHFDNVPLSDIANQLSRWYDTDFEFATDTLRHIHFTGSFLRRESLGRTLEMMQKVSSVVFSKKGEKVFVQRKE